MEYQTKQGAILLDFLRRNADRHWNAEEIARAIADEGNPVGKATVYRHLDKLVASGRLRRFFTHADTGACYQFAEEEKTGIRQHHFLCTSCGTLLHLESTHMDSLYQHLSRVHGFQVAEEQTVIYGLCKQCRK